MIRKRILFHVTERCRMAKILREGLRTKFDRRRKGRIWLCDEEQLAWALDHVAATHGSYDLACLGVQLSEMLVKQARPGIYWTYLDIPAKQVRNLPQTNLQIQKIASRLLIQE